eukprot:16286-Heterococcus_DN1.PRE.2
MTLNFTSNSSEKAGENSESGKSPLWQKGDFPSDMSNPWRSGDDSAPFDERFYISIAVAVGGVNGYFPDGLGSKPWNDTNPQAPMQFINNTENWYSTWGTDGDSALQVDAVILYQVANSFRYACYADQQIASVRVWQDSVDYSGTSMAYITPNSPNTAKTTTSGNSDSTTGNGGAQQPYYTPYAVHHCVQTLLISAASSDTLLY